MKYKILNQTDSRVELFVLYEDNTSTVLNLAQDTLENMLKNAYILSQKAEGLEDYNEKLVWSKAGEEFSKDFKNLTKNDDFIGFYDGTKLTI